MVRAIQSIAKGISTLPFRSSVPWDRGIVGSDVTLCLFHVSSLRPRWAALGAVSTTQSNATGVIWVSRIPCPNKLQKKKLVWG